MHSQMFARRRQVKFLRRILFNAMFVTIKEMITGQCFIDNFDPNYFGLFLNQNPFKILHFCAPQAYFSVSKMMFLSFLAEISGKS